MVALTPEFVQNIPDKLHDGVIYISMQYATAVHRCCCGCGSEIVTPFSPTDWKLLFDGESVSLHPSIGSWSFDCQSHYFIRRNNVVWASAMSKTQITACREYNKIEKMEALECTPDADKASVPVAASSSILKHAIMFLKRFGSR